MGDWDGNGIDDIGVVRGSVWYLRHSNGSVSSVSFAVAPIDRIIVGDWDGDGSDDLGFVRGSSWSLRSAGGIVTSFTYTGS